MRGQRLPQSRVVELLSLPHAPVCLPERMEGASATTYPPTHAAYRQATQHSAAPPLHHPSPLFGLMHHPSPLFGLKATNQAASYTAVGSPSGGTNTPAPKTLPHAHLAYSTLANYLRTTLAPHIPTSILFNHANPLSCVSLTSLVTTHHIAPSTH